MLTPSVRRQGEILSGESNPANSVLTDIAFRAALLTSGFRSVTDGDDTPAYLRGKGKYEAAPKPARPLTGRRSAESFGPRFTG